jgi:hypothetical protein
VSKAKRRDRLSMEWPYQAPGMGKTEIYGNVPHRKGKRCMKKSTSTAFTLGMAALALGSTAMPEPRMEGRGLLGRGRKGRPERKGVKRKRCDAVASVRNKNKAARKARRKARK